MPSPTCTVNGSSTTGAVALTAGATLQAIALADTTGVSTWSLTCIGTDDTTTPAAVNATLVVNNTNKTATFTAPLGDSAAIFQSRVNNGVDVNGTAQASYTTTFKVYAGTEVLVYNETTESDTNTGWNAVVNPSIRRATRVVTPTGVAATDLANLNAAIVAMAGVGEVQIKSGTLALAAAPTLASKVIVSCHPNTSIVSSMANGTGQTNSVFYAGAVIGATVALSSSPTAWTDQLAVAETATFPVGTVVTVGKAATNRFAYYTVLARSVASGAGTLTLDRPILWTFTSGNDTVAPVTSRLNGFRLFGNGASISGTGDRAVELSAAADCLVEDLKIDGSTGFGGIIASLDIGSLRSVLRKIVIQGGYGAQGGLAMESAEDCLIDSCQVVRATPYASGVAPGISMLDCMACVVRDSASSRNRIGLEFNYGGAPGEGTKRSVVTGGSFFENGSHGIQILNGSAEIQIASTQSRGNGANGLYIANSATGIQAVSSNFSNNTGDGIQISAGCALDAVGCVVSDNATIGIDAAGDLSFTGGRVERNVNNIGIQVTGTANARIANTQFTSETTNGVYHACLYPSGTGVVQVDNCMFTLTGTGTKVAIQHGGAGTVAVANSRSTGGSHGYYSTDATSILRRGANVDFSSTTTPYTTAQNPNFGTFVANGASDVTIAYTGAKATDRLVITRTIDGGTPGPTPKRKTITAGTSYTVTGTAADTSTYEWTVIT